MQTSRFLGSEIPENEPEKCLFHVLCAGLEQSVSYGQGTSRGPAAILEASQQMELWDGYSCPGELGIYTWPALDCAGLPETALSNIQAAVTKVLSYSSLPVLLGGEHTVSLGALRALQAAYGTFGIVQFDAHADLRYSYEGNSYSHACVMRRAVEDLGLPLAQFGVRALCLEELEVRRKFKVLDYDAACLHVYNFTGLPKDFPQNIYLSFDIDALDPGIMPATGTPVPGGLFWYDTLALLRKIMQQRQVIGVDLVEFAPISGLQAFDFTAAQLIYNIMGLISRETHVPCHP